MNNKNKSKKFNIKLILAIVFLIVGVILLINSISSIINAKKIYDSAYKIWREAWMNHEASLFDKPDFYITIGNAFPAFIGVVLIFFSIPLFITALHPMNKEFKKYEESVKNNSTTSDNSITDIIKSISNTVSNTVTNSTTNSIKRKSSTCSCCGAKLPKDSNTCQYCGKEND